MRFYYGFFHPQDPGGLSPINTVSINSRSASKVTVVRLLVDEPNTEQDGDDKWEFLPLRFRLLVLIVKKSTTTVCRLLTEPRVIPRSCTVRTFSITSSPHQSNFSILFDFVSCDVGTFRPYSILESLTTLRFSRKKCISFFLKLRIRVRTHRLTYT